MSSLRSVEDLLADAVTKVMLAARQLEQEPTRDERAVDDLYALAAEIAQAAKRIADKP